MKVSRRVQKIFTASAVALGVIVAGGGIAYAASTTSSTSGVSDKTIYKFGTSVNVTGVVNGDIICAAQTVNIDAVVNGDILCVAQTITISGKVNGNIRAAAQTITVNAEVSRNASIAGQDINFGESSNISGDISVASQNITANGKIGRDLSVAAATVNINGTVDRNVTAKTGEKLILGGNTKIGGWLDYTSPTVMDRSTSAVIGGKIVYHKSEPAKESNGVAWSIAWRLYWLIAMMILSVTLVAIFPQTFRRLNSIGAPRVGWALLTGFGAMIIVPIAVIITFATVFGAPLAFLMLLLWVSVFILSFPVAAYYAGSQLFSRMHPLLMVFLASLLLGILVAIPFLGGLIMFLTYLLGSGILLIGLQKSYKKPNYTSK